MNKDKKYYVEENRAYSFDFSQAVSVQELHEKYQGYGLSDVDFIAELPDRILLIEYKNSDIPGATNPDSFRQSLKTESHYIKISRKYYDSLIYALAAWPDKPYEYIYVLECQAADSVLRKLLLSKIKRRLPFDFTVEENPPRKLIDHFQIVTIQEFNQSKEIPFEIHKL